MASRLPLLRAAIARDRAAWRAERDERDAGRARPSEDERGKDESGADEEEEHGDSDETSEWSSLYSSSDTDSAQGPCRKRCRAIRTDRAAACFALTCPACRRPAGD